MTLVDCTSTMFVVLNAARVVAYIPQLARVNRDADGARAVSVATWTLLASADMATMAYALVVVSDVVVATLFGLSSLGSLAIVALTIWKRHAHAQSSWGTMSLEPPRTSAVSFGESGNLPLRSIKGAPGNLTSIFTALAIVAALFSALLFIPA